MRNPINLSLKLPLSFFATVFGMNAQELDSGTMSMGIQFMWMCKSTPAYLPR